jgi:DNA-binding response OmpR family regulator
MITLFIREDEHTVTIGVQDQGIGIPEQKQKSLFVRFENFVDRNLFNQSSTGIGLSLVKELVTMHHAQISVRSKEHEGSCFSVTFLKGWEHYDDTIEYLQEDGIPTESLATAESEPELSPRKEAKATADPDTPDTPDATMLLVEDNDDLRRFLHAIFADKYRIVEAENGVQGEAQALKYLPDIIVSDVMMPEKDGISLTRDLRANLTTSHIPIILLTAKTSVESQLEGLEYGADDYITKPFSATYLKARVKNLLTRQADRQHRYRDSLTADEPTAAEPTVAEPPMAPADRRFMELLMELMERNMDNGELKVDDLVSEMMVSRSVFFKKLKTLTGLAPIEFIREMRIKRAIQLIESEEFSMSQIAYMVGINDPRYFSKCFKHLVGVSPTEYKDNYKKEKYK